MAESRLNAVLVQKVEASPELAIFRVVSDGWELPDFVPGQFAVLGLPGAAQRYPGSDVEEASRDPDALIKRAYSIASSSVAKEFMEFYVSLLPSGALTPRLFALNPGDKVWLGAKVTGMFTLDQVSDGGHVVLIATGTGLAPYMSMLRSQLSCGSERRFAVLHGARHTWDLGYRSELMSMKRMCSNFSYVPIISRADEEVAEWSGPVGYIQDLWARACKDECLGWRPSPEDTHIFLCGNPGMIEGMVELLESEGFREHSRKAPGQIHVERYW